MTSILDAQAVLLRHLETVATDIGRHEQDEFTLEFADSILTRLQSMYRWAVQLSSVLHTSESLAGSIRDCIILVSQQIEASQSRLAIPPQEAGARGRPKFIITRQQLEYLLENDFSVPKIAAMLRVSVSTIRRRMTHFGILVQDYYTEIDERALASEIEDIKTNHPQSGYRMMHSLLKLRGIRVPIHRVRQACFEVDPAGSMTRWATTIRRRSYSVPGPNSLWHIDGNHKLIRYEMLIQLKKRIFLRLLIHLQMENGATRRNRRIQQSGNISELLNEQQGRDCIQCL